MTSTRNSGGGAPCAARPNTTALYASIRKAEREVDRIADTLIAVGVSDTLRARLATAEARLATLRAGRKAVAAAAAARLVTLPTRSDVPRLLGSLTDVLAEGALQARQRLQEQLQPVVLTARVRGDDVSYMVELNLEVPTAPSMKGAPSGEADSSVCGGPLLGLPRTMLRALVPTTRGPGAIRVLAPKMAA